MHESTNIKLNVHITILSNTMQVGCIERRSKGLDEGSGYVDLKMSFYRRQISMQEDENIKLGEFAHHDTFVPFLICLLTQFSRFNTASIAAIHEV
jgi:hypothetical protein